MKTSTTKVVGMWERSLRAFTLLELLVAVGAVALISVGIAAIFQTIGKTVTGGQRVSAMSQAASMIEQQLRRDFNSITRQGFLVIRQQVTTQQNGQQLLTPVHDEDGNPRPRRVDEVLFFSEGDFVSAREPMNPEMIARGNQAMVYYGHGLRAAHTSQPGQPLRPDVRPPSWSVNDPGADQTGWLGELNSPNRFAKDWSLLRRQVMLTQPGGRSQTLPRRGWIPPLDGAAAIPRALVMDKRCQIALQPAVSSVFRDVARVLHDNGAGAFNPTLYVRGTEPPGQPAPPRLSSGLVDIASTDLDEIRSAVQSHDRLPSQINSGAEYLPIGYDPQIPDGATLDGSFVAGIGGIDRMRAWMVNALPTQSDMGSSAPARAADPKGARMRYEPAPPDYIGVINDTSYTPVQETYRRADQVMLNQGVFVPRCTEFMVEWSFGEQSVLDPDGDGTDVTWYGFSDLAQRPVRFSQYGGAYQAFAGGLPANAGRAVTALVYGSSQPPDDQTQTVCFGYIDPNYRPPAPVAGQPEAFPRALPWPWPRMVRVTMVICDERDPSATETFQWVFDLPKNERF